MTTGARPRRKQYDHRRSDFHPAKPRQRNYGHARNESRRHTNTLTSPDRPDRPCSARSHLRQLIGGDDAAEQAVRRVRESIRSRYADFDPLAIHPIDRFRDEGGRVRRHRRRSATRRRRDADEQAIFDAMAAEKPMRERRSQLGATVAPLSWSTPSAAPAGDMTMRLPRQRRRPTSGRHLDDDSRIRTGAQYCAS